MPFEKALRPQDYIEMSNGTELGSTSPIEQHNNPEKDLKAKKRITKYVETSNELYMRESKSLKSELSKAHLGLVCLQNESLLLSGSSARSTQYEVEKTPAGPEISRQRRLAKRRQI